MYRYLFFFLLLLVVSTASSNPAPFLYSLGDSRPTHHVAGKPLTPGNSCRGANLCCAGRDARCGIQKERSLDGEIPLCYCDHACLRLGDCCDDFKSYCGVHDCVVSDWESWSECSADCGPGQMTRQRRIRRQPSNGGAACADLQQKRGCYGTRCGEGRTVGNVSESGRLHHHFHPHRETAMILPVQFATLRSMNDSNDIRQNLKYLPKNGYERHNDPYVVIFEVIKVRKDCETLDGFEPLESGKQICVTCQATAMRKHLGKRCRGHGVDNHESRFSALGNPQCEGRWIRKHRLGRCPHSEHFIFV